MAGNDVDASADGDGDRPLRVAFVSQWFAPEPIAGPGWIAESLQRQGLHVSVLTGIPNFPSGTVMTGFSPWRRLKERRLGFDVLRAPLYPNHGRSAVQRFANYASFAISSAVVGSRLIRSSDVALVYSSPATAATAAMISPTPYVLLIQDLWPDSIFATGFVTGLAARRAAEVALSWYTRQAYERAAHIAVTGPGMRDLLIRRGVPAEKVSVVYNWVDEKVMRPTEPDPDFRTRLGLVDKFVLMYAGNHGAAQSLDVVIKAMAELRDVPEIHLALLGDGITKLALRELAEGLRLSSIHFLDPVTPERMPSLMAAADLQLVPLADQELFKITLPSKVQGILACGQPVLACARGDAARIVERSGAGFTTPPDDPIALAQAIRDVHTLPRDRLRAMGRAGHDYYTTTLSESVNASALADALRRAAKDRNGVSGG